MQRDIFIPTCKTWPNLVFHSIWKRHDRSLHQKCNIVDKWINKYRLWVVEFKENVSMNQKSPAILGGQNAPRNLKFDTQLVTKSKNQDAKLINEFYVHNLLSNKYPKYIFTSHTLFYYGIK